MLMTQSNKLLRLHKTLNKVNMLKVKLQKVIRISSSLQKHQLKTKKSKTEKVKNLLRLNYHGDKRKKTIKKKSYGHGTRALKVKLFQK